MELPQNKTVEKENDVVKGENKNIIQNIGQRGRVTSPRYTLKDGFLNKEDGKARTGKYDQDHQHLLQTFEFPPFL